MTTVRHEANMFSPEIFAKEVEKIEASRATSAREDSARALRQWAVERAMFSGCEFVNDPRGVVAYAAFLVKFVEKGQ